MLGTSEDSGANFDLQHEGVHSHCWARRQGCRRSSWKSQLLGIPHERGNSRNYPRVATDNLRWRHQWTGQFNCFEENPKHHHQQNGTSLRLVGCKSFAFHIFQLFLYSIFLLYRTHTHCAVVLEKKHFAKSSRMHTAWLIAVCHKMLPPFVAWPMISTKQSTRSAICDKMAKAKHLRPSNWLVKFATNWTIWSAPLRKPSSVLIRLDIKLRTRLVNNKGLEYSSFVPYWIWMLINDWPIFVII